MSEAEFVVVWSRPAARTKGARIGRTLVEERLAACANVVGPIRSIYRWQGAVEDAEEQLLVLKARAADFAALEARVRALHSLRRSRSARASRIRGRRRRISHGSTRRPGAATEIAGGRPPVTREFSAGGLVCRCVRGEWTVCLAGRRIHPRERPRLDPPKGHVEEGEHMEETALREVREETGLEAEIIDRLRRRHLLVRRGASPRGSRRASSSAYASS